MPPKAKRQQPPAPRETKIPHGILSEDLKRVIDALRKQPTIKQKAIIAAFLEDLHSLFQQGNVLAFSAREIVRIWLNSPMQNRPTTNNASRFIREKSFIVAQCQDSPPKGRLIPQQIAEFMQEILFPRPLNDLSETVEMIQPEINRLSRDISDKQAMGKALALGKLSKIIFTPDHSGYDEHKKTLAAIQDWRAEDVNGTTHAQILEQPRGFFSFLSSERPTSTRIIDNLWFKAAAADDAERQLYDARDPIALQLHYLREYIAQNQHSRAAAAKVVALQDLLTSILLHPKGVSLSGGELTKIIDEWENSRPLIGTKRTNAELTKDYYLWAFPTDSHQRVEGLRRAAKERRVELSVKETRLGSKSPRTTGNSASVNFLDGHDDSFPRPTSSQYHASSDSDTDSADGLSVSSHRSIFLPTPASDLASLKKALAGEQKRLKGLRDPKEGPKAVLIQELLDTKTPTTPTTRRIATEEEKQRFFASPPDGPVARPESPTAPTSPRKALAQQRAIKPKEQLAIIAIWRRTVQGMGKNYASLIEETTKGTRPLSAILISQIWAKAAAPESEEQKLKQAKDPFVAAFSTLRTYISTNQSDKSKVASVVALEELLTRILLHRDGILLPGADCQALVEAWKGEPSLITQGQNNFSLMSPKSMKHIQTALESMQTAALQRSERATAAAPAARL